MKITIAVANHKGGCGKTSLSMLLSSTLSNETYRVAVVDLDPQGSAGLWSQAGQGQFPAQVVPATADTLKAVLKGLDVDLVILDCPPSSTAPETLAAIDCADLIVVPALPSSLDYWATDALAIAVLLRRPSVPRLVVLNQQNYTNLATELTQVFRQTWTGEKSQADDAGTTVAEHSLGDRIVYREAAARGLGIRQLPGRPNKEALNELDALAVEVLKTAIRAK